MRGKKVFTEAVQRAVYRSNFSVEDIAQRLDKRPSSLYNELNPMPMEGCHPKLGIEDFVLILEIIGDLSPLQYLNDHFHLDTSPRNVQPDKPTLEQELLDNHPEYVRFEQMVLNSEPFDDVQRQAHVVKREVDEDVEAYRQRCAEEGHVYEGCKVKKVRFGG